MNMIVCCYQQQHKTVQTFSAVQADKATKF